MKAKTKEVTDTKVSDNGEIKSESVDNIASIDRGNIRIKSEWTA